MQDLPLHVLNVTHFDATVPSAARTVIEVRSKVSKLRLVLGVSIVGLLAAGGLALYWWWTRGKGGFGVGFGSGKGASSIFGQGGDPSGEGGDATAPGEPGDTAADGSVSETPSADQTGGGSSNGGKPGDPKGDPGNVGADKQGKTGSGKDGSKDSKGDGGSQGDGSGGSGGGSGGGIGDGQGAGEGGDDDDASVGIAEGGGEDDGEYAGRGGGTMIDVDLDPPELSPAVLAKLRTDVEDLVLGAVLDPGVDAPGLPPGLHAYDPAFGQVWWFWADVALYYNFPELPWGRLDPDNKTHIPWIELSVDLYRYVLIIDLGENTGEEIEGAVQSAVQSWGRRGDPLRRLLWSARAPRKVRVPRHYAVNTGRTRS